MLPGRYRGHNQNELALMTVIAALRKLTKPCEVAIKINSPYVQNQIRNLKNWEARGWRRAAGRELKTNNSGSSYRC